MATGMTEHQSGDEIIAHGEVWIITSRTRPGYSVISTNGERTGWIADHEIDRDSALVFERDRRNWETEIIDEEFVAPLIDHDANISEDPIMSLLDRLDNVVDALENGNKDILQDFIEQERLKFTSDED